MVMGGSWGARPPYCSGAPPCATPRLGPRAAPARWCGLARWPRPPREQAAGGTGARCVQVQPHPAPPRRGPFWGRGVVPSAPGGGGALLWPSCWGGGSGGGAGGAAPPTPAPRPIGRRPAIRCIWLAPRGILVPWRLPGGGGRGGNPPALVRAPFFPRPDSEGAALFAPSWAPPVRHRSAAGRAGACGRFTEGRLPRLRCPLTPGAAASSGGVRGCRLFAGPPSALGPEGEGGGVGGGLRSPCAAA